MKDYIVTKAGENKYTCSEAGVSYHRVNGSYYWVAQLRRSSIKLKKVKSFSAKEDFDKAVDDAVKTIRHWKDKYGLNDTLTAKDMNKILSTKTDTKSIMTKGTKRKPKKRVIIKRSDIKKAMDEYLANGGTITKLSACGTEVSNSTWDDRYLIS